MDLEEVIKFITEIKKDITENYTKPFCEKVNEKRRDMVTGSQNQNNTEEEGYLKSLHDKNGVDLESTLNKANKELEKKSQVLEEKKADIEKLAQKLEERKKELANEIAKIERIKQKTKAYEQKMQKLENIRDCIQVSKILTGTNFAYRKNIVSGYVKLGEQFEVFDYNKSNVSNDEIQTRLWDLIEKLSKTDE